MGDRQACSTPPGRWEIEVKDRMTAIVLGRGKRAPASGRRPAGITVCAVAVLLPSSVEEAVDALAAHPGAHLLAGGTDLMVEVNAGHRRPADVVALGRVAGLRRWHHDAESGTVAIGAGVTFASARRHAVHVARPGAGPGGAHRRLAADPQRRRPSAATSARRRRPATRSRSSPRSTPPSPSPVRRDAGTIADPRPLHRGQAHVAGSRASWSWRPRSPCSTGTRASRRWASATPWSSPSPAPAWPSTGPRRTVRVALGAVGPTVLRAREAEAWVGRSSSTGTVAPPAPTLAGEFGERVAAEARPIDDHRSTARYRRHAVGVLASRLLVRAFPEGPPA